MKVEELKAEFERLSREDKQRLMMEVGMGFCREMMGDPAFMERMMPRCMEIMDQASETMRARMREWITGSGVGRKS